MKRPTKIRERFEVNSREKIWNDMHSLRKKLHIIQVYLEGPPPPQKIKILFKISTPITDQITQLKSTFHWDLPITSYRRFLMLWRSQFFFLARLVRTPIYRHQSYLVASWSLSCRWYVHRERNHVHSAIVYVWRVFCRTVSDLLDYFRAKTGNFNLKNGVFLEEKCWRRIKNFFSYSSFHWKFSEIFRLDFLS